MRIVMVAHAYPRRAGDVAGSFIARLAETLVRRGHEVVAVAPADRGSARRFALNGVEVVQVRYANPARETLAYAGDMAERARSPRGLWTFWALVRALTRATAAEARRHQADLVHAWWWVPGGWAATRTGFPTVISLLGTDVALLRGAPARVLGHRVLGRARAVTTISRYLATETRRRSYRPQLPIALIPVPADGARFTRLSRGGGGIAYLGRLTAQKRVDLLLRAAHHAGITVPITVVGDGPARPALERLTAELGLTTVRFLGTLPDTGVVSAIGDADALAFLARSEGLGLAAAEAQMLGIPVVATEDGGGVLDLVQEGRGGRIVPPTAAAVGAALQGLLHDSTARVAARAAGDALRERLSSTIVAQEFEAVYAQCGATPSAPHR